MKRLICFLLGHNVHVTQGLIYPSGYCERCGKFVRMGID